MTATRSHFALSLTLLAAACGGASTEIDLASSTGVGLSVSDSGDLRAVAPPAQTGTLAVRSQHFETWPALFAYAVDHLGGTPVRDEHGTVIGVQGVSVVSGDVQFVDHEAGVSFADAELVPALLGGADGVVHVGGTAYQIGGRRGETSGPRALAITADERVCNPGGTDCVTGHSWRTGAVFYQSVGSHTQQTSGGYTTRYYSCCPNGTAVTLNGVAQCKIATAWIPANQNPTGKPIPIAFRYVPQSTCSYQAVDNLLQLSVLPLGTYSGPWSNPAAQMLMRSEANTLKVELSAWAIGFNVDFGVFKDVRGVCGYHKSSRGGRARTRAGDVNDYSCQQGNPYAGF